MKATLRRVTATFLSLTMIFSMVGIAPVLAADETESGSQWQIETNGDAYAYHTVGASSSGLAADAALSTDSASDSYEKASVEISKEITASTTENQFDITLTVATTDDIDELELKPDAAVVLVLDKSLSMAWNIAGTEQADGWPASDDTARMDLAKEAALGFVSDFATNVDDTTQRMVSVVSFARYATVNQGWTNVADSTTAATAAINKLDVVNTADDNLSSDQLGGTNIEAGLLAAYDLLDDTAIDGISNVYVVLLSDGAPTYYDNNGTPVSSSKAYGSTSIGYGDVADQTESAATKVQGAVNTLYTIAFAEANNPAYYSSYTSDKNYTTVSITDWFTASIASDKDYHYNAASGDELSFSFSSIIESIATLANVWTVNDTMGSFINLNTNSFIDIKNEVSDDVTLTANGFTWDLKNAPKQEINGKNTYSLTYTINLDTTANGFKADTFYLTNGHTYLTYIFADEILNMEDVQSSDISTLNFNVPAVKGNAPTYTLTVNHVDTNGDTVADSVVTTDIPLHTEYTTKTATVKGYTLSETPANATGTIAGDTVVTYVYDMNQYDLIVEHYDADTGLLIEGDWNTEESLPHGTLFTVSSATIPHYTWNGSLSIYNEMKYFESSKVSAVLTQDTLAKYYYTQNEYTVSVYHRDAAGNTLAYGVFTDGYHAGDDYTSAQATIEGYNFVTTTGHAASGTVDGNMVVTYIYSPEGYSLTVNHVDTNGNTIAPQEVDDTVVYNQSYTTAQATIAGYTYLELADDSATATGTIKGDTVVTYVYSQNKYEVVANYQDANGKVLASSVTTAGYVLGADYTTPSQDINGYYFVTTTGDAPSGTITGNMEVIYVYSQSQYTLTVNHVDEAGNALVDATTTENMTYDQSYTTAQATIEGYSFLKMADDSAATAGAITGHTVVTYVYAKNQYTLTVNHVDQAGNTLAPSTSEDKLFNDDYTTAQVSIENYGFLNMADDSAAAAGTIKGDTVVTYVYTLTATTYTVEHYLAVDNGYYYYDGSYVASEEAFVLIEEATKEYGATFGTDLSLISYVESFANYGFDAQTLYNGLEAQADFIIDAENMTLKLYYTADGGFSTAVTYNVNHYVEIVNGFYFDADGNPVATAETGYVLLVEETDKETALGAIISVADENQLGQSVSSVYYLNDEATTWDGDTQFTITAGGETLNLYYTVEETPAYVTLTVKWVDESGNELSSSFSRTIMENGFGTSYDTVNDLIGGEDCGEDLSQKYFSGYTFKAMHADSDETTGFLFGETTVVYVYSKNTSSGGSSTTTTTPDDDDDDNDDIIVEVPDEDVPLVEVPDEDVPLVEIPDENVPLSETAEEVPVIEIPEENVPLSDIPQTGDTRNLALLVAVAMLSATGLAWLVKMELDEKKKATN